jgi:hypothetical protein
MSGQRRKVTRRSFLSRVLGTVVAGGSLSLIAGSAPAHPISDNDPSDSPGAGRGRGQWPHADTDQGTYSDAAGRAGRLGHFSDQDRGPGADPANHGRRMTDQDPGDAPNHRPNLSDRDAGPHADAVGRGRRPRRR